MRHIFVQVGSQNAIDSNTNKFENNSMNSLWPFYIAVTEPVVIATSSFLSTASRNTAAFFFLVLQERHKCVISGLINIFKFWLKYFYCTIILLYSYCRYTIPFIYFLFFGCTAQLADLSSLPRDQIHALSSESAEF